MKKTFTFIICVSILLACANNINKNEATIQFLQNEHNFGTLPFKKEVEYSFEFLNPGENMLLINNVRTSCGCTVADWPKKPIKPKESGKISVKYDSEFPGMFHKEITVYYNGEDSPAILQIKGQVRYLEENYPEEQ